MYILPTQKKKKSVLFKEVKRGQKRRINKYLPPGGPVPWLMLSIYALPPPPLTGCETPFSSLETGSQGGQPALRAEVK